MLFALALGKKCMKNKTSKKLIQPQYRYDKDKKPIEVYLSIEDYEALMLKLKNLREKNKATSKR